MLNEVQTTTKLSSDGEEDANDSSSKKDLM